MTDPVVNIPLKQIYEQVQATDKKVDELTTAVGELVAVNKRLDNHHAKLDVHDRRIDVLEQHKAILDSRVKAPWWIVLGAVVTVVTGLVAIVSLLDVMSTIADVIGEKK